MKLGREVERYTKSSEEIYCMEKFLKPINKQQNNFLKNLKRINTFEHDNTFFPQKKHSHFI